LTADLIGLAIAFILALATYEKLSDFLIHSTNLSVIYARPLSFLGIWFTAQIVFFGLSKIVSHFTPVSIKQSPINIYLGLLPSFIKAAFFIVVSLILIIVMPLDQKTKNLFTGSYLSRNILKYSIKLENELEKVFNNSSSTLTFITNQDNQNEQTDLKFSTTQMTIDENAEQLLLNKINEERIKINVKPLISDVLVRNVARTHSRDMLIRGYFSHNSIDGRTLADRLLDAAVAFQAAAENIALAPNANLAHLGLMNSEKHRDNILDPEFTKIGIGVMDAGQYGIMVTQDFFK